MSARPLKHFVSWGKKIVGAARTYRDHAIELGNPVPTEPFVFLKPTTAYIREGESIKLPYGSTEIAHEVELGVIVGQRGSCIPETEALKYIGGYCLALDMTDRIAQQAAKTKGLPWSVAKGFDTSCPVSDFIPLEKIPDPQNVDLWLKVNGEMRQSSNTKNMIFSIPYLISWMSYRFTLEPGDLILTGTPEGVGPVKEGDQIECGLADMVRMTYNVEQSNSN